MKTVDRYADRVQRLERGALGNGISRSKGTKGMNGADGIQGRIGAMARAMRCVAVMASAMGAGLLLALTLATFGAPAFGETFDADALQRLLQASPRPEVRFTESRESPWLSAPAVSSGTLSMQPGLLEKRVQTPRRETYRLLADRMQVESVGRDQAVIVKELSFKEAPAVAALAHSLRLVMAGDLAALREHFDLTVSGEARLWSVRLVPRRTSISRTLQQIDMQGSYGQLMVIVTQEARGERTTTRLLAPIVATIGAPTLTPDHRAVNSAP
ncbi:MAG: hypothetical protein JWQ11_3743 [Rhizobacter sp.]|nr:hypothetical protein [Rhizobacter sp.]